MVGDHNQFRMHLPCMMLNHVGYTQAPSGQYHGDSRNQEGTPIARLMLSSTGLLDALAGTIISCEDDLHMLRSQLLVRMKQYYDLTKI